MRPALTRPHLHRWTARHPWPWLAITVSLAISVSGCGGTDNASATAPATGISTTVSPPATSAPALMASPTPAATPATPVAMPSPSPSPTPAARPTLETFWSAVTRGVETAGHLRIRVIGPNPGILRYEPAASETLIDDRVAFICVDGAAYDGQSGSFARVPGTWSCGGDALVSGFRRNGEPLDSWSKGLPGDEDVTETVSLEPDGRWRWDYVARSPVFGGPVKATVWVDPASGQIRDAVRTDPTGDTRYGINYSETFPPIETP